MAAPIDPSVGGTLKSTGTVVINNVTVAGPKVEVPPNSFPANVKHTNVV